MCCFSVAYRVLGDLKSGNPCRLTVKRKNFSGHYFVENQLITVRIYDSPAGRFQLMENKLGLPDHAGTCWLELACKLIGFFLNRYLRSPASRLKSMMTIKGGWGNRLCN